MVCSVSKDECLGVDSSKPNPRDIPTTLRHLSIMVDDPLVLSKVPRLKNLHTLVLWIHGHDRRWAVMVNKVLKGFKNLRVLKLESSATCKHRSLNAIGDLKHLRYLHLDKIVDTTPLTKSVYKLYHLQTMIVLCLDPSTKRIGEGMKSLINLRHLILPSVAIPTIAKIGKLTSLQELDKFHVREGNGCKIGELKHLRELRGELHIKNLENVRSCEDAREAELHNKEHLRTLVLQWDTNSSSTSEVAANIIDGLRPHFCLADLKIIGYSGACPPCWLETRYLAMLESITLSNCEELELLPPLEELPFLKFLSLENMRALRQVGHPFPRRNMVTSFGRLEVLKFRNIQMLARWSGVEDGQWFPCLKILKIEHCSRLMALPPLPHSLERLEIYDVGLTTLPRLWQCQNNDCESSSPSNLRLLKIQSCRNLTSLDGGLLQHTDHFMAVEELFIQQCKALVHLPVEGFQKLISLRSLQIRKCPRLQRRNAPHDDFFLPLSVRTISMMDCGEMDASLPGAMQHLASLSMLVGTHSFTAFPSAEVFRRLKVLHNLSIVRCTELTSFGGLH
ncbi:putative disease resistance protein RGA3 [Phoenix dactylifera]|uniref:Disease resistance protein RGA3 n=1 Tax=Phoenix dactylifera TaxID=42345 RepID=A0A8B9A1X1_PHODC|nr:putative disease resistance protein RGA3 [Phoenix dactylifera]